jgi:homoaconitase/3-isopropylmalate dehydratase large subunit
MIPCPCCCDRGVGEAYRNSLPDGLSARQVSRLVANAERFEIPYIPIHDDRHGIVHVIGPEQPRPVQNLLGQQIVAAAAESLSYCPGSFATQSSVRC